MERQRAHDAEEAIPSDEERRYLRLLWSYFQQQGEWPNRDRLQRAVDRDPERIDLWAISSSISYRLARLSWGNEREPSVTVRGAYEADRESPELVEFLRLALRCLELYAGGEEDPKLLRLDLPQDEFIAKKAVRLLQGESSFVQTREDELSAGWSRSLNLPVIRRFIGMTDLASYLELEGAEAPRRKAAAESVMGGAALADLISPPWNSPGSDLLRTLLPTDIAHSFLTPLQEASTRFRQARTDEERRSVVRDVAFLLEGIRAELDEALPDGKDNAAIFQIANQFYIRHSKADQFTDYDPLWLSWVFHLFEATAYTWLGLVIQAHDGP